MARGARVESIDALKAFQTALWKFAETARVALGEAEAEIQRVLTWVETEQHTYWQGQIRKRTEIVSKAKDAVRQKKLFRDSSGRTPSAVDEEKALALAVRRLEEAEQKLASVRRWRGRLQKELDLYKGSVQGFATTVEQDIPLAAARLDRMVTILEQYLTLSPSSGGAQPAGSLLASLFASSETSASSMAQADSAAPQPLPGDPRQLRQKTPAPSARAKTPPGSLPPDPWKAGLISAAQQRVLLAMNLAQRSINPESTILIAPDAVACDRIYLERTSPASQEDSGWYIGPVDAETPDAPQAIRISDLLAVRPDLHDLLSLPEGYLLVIDADGVKTLLDAQDQDLWQSDRTA